MTHRSFINFLCLGNRAVTILNGSSSRLPHIQMEIRSIASQAEIGFKPAKVAVVTKMTRYEFEQQRYRFSELSEEDLKQLLALKGSSYIGLLERHNIHIRNVEHIVESLQKERIEVRVVKRGEYDEETGMGLCYLSPVRFSIKTNRFLGLTQTLKEGHLCLPVRYTHAFPEALQKLRCGQFRWQWRHRIRLHLEGTGINPTPVDLHEQQLSLEQHNQAHRITLMEAQRSEVDSLSKPYLLPVRGLNEIFIGESLSSRASYYEISVDDRPSYNINKLVEQAVEDVLRIGKAQTGLDIPLSQDFIEKVTDEYNESLVFGPEEGRMFFSIREPIVNRVFSSSHQRGFANRVCVRSRCWDACMVVDGGTSFEFNDGAIATITMNEEDQLRTVLLEN
ncbi:unnamed protein product [Coregonus sp. 'balchen']|nr:unnamed protein product [Coregonus sp. 'balchen']